MAQGTSEDEAALNEVMHLLEAHPVDTTSANSLVPLMIKPQLNVRNWQFKFRLEKQKKPSVCS